jgi:hypothetical protein
MVVFQIKRNDGDSFLYETSCETAADDAVREITEIWNMRLRLGQLCGAIRELARYGPMKPPDKAGLDEVMALVDQSSLPLLLSYRCIDC